MGLTRFILMYYPIHIDTIRLEQLLSNLQFNGLVEEHSGSVGRVLDFASKGRWRHCVVSWSKTLNLYKPSVLFVG